MAVFYGEAADRVSILDNLVSDALSTATSIAAATGTAAGATNVTTTVQSEADGKDLRKLLMERLEMQTSAPCPNTCCRCHICCYVMLCYALACYAVLCYITSAL